MSDITIFHDNEPIPFDALYVKLKGSEITRIPYIPASVVILELIGCSNIKRLPELPETLRGLYIWDTPIYIVEFPLPSKLTSLVIHDCMISDPFDFPNTLKCLHLTGNILPPVDTLPPNLVSFRYAHNKNISTLPVLPPSLKNLDIEHTNISEIVEFPPSLVSFWYEDTPLITLPAIPATLKRIVCD